MKIVTSNKSRNVMSAFNMNRLLLTGARWLSNIFRPEFMPVVGFIALFLFTYLNLLPWNFKAIVLSFILLGTIILPHLTILFWRKSRGWELHLLRLRENRYFPYLIYFLYYAFTLHFLYRLHLPHYMSGILVGALIIQGCGAVINHWWKISMHCAGAGGIIGALMAYSFLFFFSPLGWLCLCIFISGLVGSSRMLLRQHDLWQVICGTLLGVAGGFVGIILF